MFGVDSSELLLIMLVAVVVIGPKDLPRVLRTVGHWVGKARGMANQFRAGMDQMVRESEIAELEKKWREQNEAIMKAHPFTPETDGDWGKPDAFAKPDAPVNLGKPDAGAPQQAMPPATGSRPAPTPPVGNGSHRPTPARGVAVAEAYEAEPVSTPVETPIQAEAAPMSPAPRPARRAPRVAPRQANP